MLSCLLATSTASPIAVPTELQEQSCTKNGGEPCLYRMTGSRCTHMWCQVLWALSIARRRAALGVAERMFRPRLRFAINVRRERVSLDRSGDVRGWLGSFDRQFGHIFPLIRDAGIVAMRFGCCWKHFDFLQSKTCWRLLGLLSLCLENPNLPQIKKGSMTESIIWRPAKGHSAEKNFTGI